MNSMISFFVGCVTFAIMFLVKIPIKKCTMRLARENAADAESQYCLFKRYNLILIAFTMAIALVCYTLVLRWLGETHFKLCCTFKAGAIATAFYAVYEQWFGEDTKW